MTFQLISAEEWTERCNADGEFSIAARHWNGGIKIIADATAMCIGVENGIAGIYQPEHAHGLLTFEAPAATWEKQLAELPPRFFNDVMANMSTQSGMRREGDRLAGAQYYPAAARALELLRPIDSGTRKQTDITKREGAIDTPVGRYVHLELDGFDHRVYFEEAGQGGIPLLLQHTAGCHGSQWRHLFEDNRITSHFHLIAYDLPYHGKSLPPVEKNWWQENYQLRGEFLRSIPIKLSECLDLDRPVFMGCSVGGLLALDLACRHPDKFDSVISVEGALNIEGNLEGMQEMWHPQVSSDYKARAMEGLIAPGSPIEFKKETGFVYSSAWPAAFLGDLTYYIEDFDIRNLASEIDTDLTSVHILSGEYDWSGKSELGREAHEMIKGSTWSEMQGVGHFPMSENPKVFIKHLLPILEMVRQRRSETP